MGKILIVAEKPSQAREYASALGVKGKRDGYFENEFYVITWCYGHLMELERPEAYMDIERVGKRWSLGRLPVLPSINQFRRVVKEGTIKQFNVVQNWLKSSDVTEVICGTDADREGQLLFQEVWEASHSHKPLSRLWISSLTSAAIREGFEKLRSADSVAGLAAAGHGRAYADWDFGMNLTEAFTSLFGSFDTVRKRPNVISIGRVQTPTLALIVEREWEIECFVSEPFFEIKAEFTAEQGEYWGKWYDPQEESKRLMNLLDVKNIVAKTQGKSGMITKLGQKNIQEPPPLLFDLTSLTIAASKKYGYSAERVLQVAQALYEKKGITYPRTDCAYLSEDLIAKLPDHLKAVHQEPYINLADEASTFGVPSGKRVINTITAHHAIIPTTEKISIDRLSPDEKNLYDLIVRRFIAVWYPPACYHQTDVVTEVESEYFRTKGKVLLELGWKAVYGNEELVNDSGRSRKKRDQLDQVDQENISLPPLNKGEGIKVKQVISLEKTTKPPKRYTQGDLLKAMESVGKHIDDEILRQEMKGKGLGTVATRPAILESLIDRGYILQEQKSLRPTAKGVELIRLIKERLPKAQLLISPEMTGQMEFNLSKVEKGELVLEKYMADVEYAIGLIIAELRDFEHRNGKVPLALSPIKQADLKSPDKIKRQHSRQSQLKESPYEGVGTCPRCGGDIIEGQKGFGCTRWREGCSFVVWKTPICGKVLTRSQVKSLLKKGKTPLIKGFKSKSGKSFMAYVVWENRDEAKLKLEFRG